MELLYFFNEALSVDRVDRSTILENGDVVIMDNCGFHHGHFVEPLLHGMPAGQAVSRFGSAIFFFFFFFLRRSHKSAH